MESVSAFIFLSYRDIPMCRSFFPCYHLSIIITRLIGSQPLRWVNFELTLRCPHLPNIFRTWLSPQKNPVTWEVSEPLELVKNVQSGKHSTSDFNDWHSGNYHVPWTTNFQSDCQSKKLLWYNGTLSDEWWVHLVTMLRRPTIVSEVLQKPPTGPPTENTTPYLWMIGVRSAQLQELFTFANLPSDS